MDKSVDTTAAHIESADNSSGDPNAAVHVPHHIRIDQGNEALVLDVGLAGGEKGDAGSLKLAKNGHTVLIPQPSDDPNDPLNWSWGKKHMILFIVGLSAFLGDFGSGAGVPLIVLQGEEWGLSPNHVNFAGNLNVLML
ncbi:hypothetical protein F5884DRAFT_25951 [Xylogone sp. PMI_703]|nr:hypothetical protein F5884DRAFT_25951 [Xylogone sp. PMI_703]